MTLCTSCRGVVLRVADTAATTVLRAAFVFVPTRRCWGQETDARSVFSGGTEVLFEHSLVCGMWRSLFGLKGFLPESLETPREYSVVSI